MFPFPRIVRSIRHRCILEGRAGGISRLGDVVNGYMVIAADGCRRGCNEL